MPDCPPHWHPAKHVTLGIVRYDVCVTPHGSGFIASWLCTVCGERGAFEPVCESADEAVKATQIGIEVHHAFVHSAADVAK